MTILAFQSGQSGPRHRHTVLCLVAVLCLAGCSSLNCTRLEQYLGGETDLISFSGHITDQLVQRAMPPLVPYQPDMTIVVTTFVDNNDLGQTSQFGRILQEHVRSRFVQLGYTVRDIKLADALTITPKSGETMLSRDLSRLKPNLNAQAIAVGTISRSERVLYISARLLSPRDATILSSVDYRLCMDDNILAMFDLRRGRPYDDGIAEPRQPLLNTFMW